MALLRHGFSSAGKFAAAYEQPDFMSSSEFQLLTLCASTRPKAQSITALTQKNIDWQLILNLAQIHCVRPLLYRSLKSTCWDVVCHEVRAKLEAFNKENTVKNLRFAAELLQISSDFRRHSVRVAAFKGPVLAVSVYDNLSLREFSDLDLIVEEVNLSKAENILTARGYKPDFEDRVYRSTFLSYQGQYAFRHPNTGVSVDLHWRLASKSDAFPPKLIEFLSDEIWSRLDWVTIANQKTATLRPLDLVLFLAAHGAKEGWRHLVWLCDFAELLRKYQDLDWKEVREHAQRTHSVRPLLLAVYLAHTLLDAPAPLALIDTASKNPAVKKLAGEAQIRILNAAPGNTDTEPELGEFLRGLKTHERFAEKLLSVTTLLTTRTVGDYQALPLPKGLWGAYYFTRPFRLIFKVVANMIRTGNAA